MCTDVACIFLLMSDFKISIAQLFEATVIWARRAWFEIEPHLPWIGTLFGIVMGAWRWWDKREAVVWRRVMRLLGDQGRYVQDSCAYSLAAILYPSPATPPRRSVFAVSALRGVFARRWWHPMEVAVPITWATGLLQRALDQLNDKDTTISLHRSFAVGQRYSAYVLQGALASAYAANGQDVQGRTRLNQTALERFEDALALEGKASDAVLLELKALQLRKLERPQDAIAELDRLQELLEGRLQAVAPLSQTERQSTLVQILRAARYQAEMDHAAQGHPAANARLLAITQGPLTNAIFRAHLEHRDRLQRAQFHEVHACVRARITGYEDAAGNFMLPANGVAHLSLRFARNDYEALRDQVDPRRLAWPVRAWRWLRRSDRKDGSLELRIAAQQGLRRVRDIEAGKRCQFCHTSGGAGATTS